MAELERPSQLLGPPAAQTPTRTTDKREAASRDVGGASTELIELKRQLGELRHELASKDRTINELTAQMEKCAGAVGATYGIHEQKALLEQLVLSKTTELRRQREELREALETLQHAQAQLLQAEKLEAIGSLAAGIAHEINTPSQYVSDNVVFLKKAFSKMGDCVVAYRTLAADLARGEHIDEIRIAAENDRIARARVDFLLEEIPGAIAGAQEGLSRVTTIVCAMKEFSHPSAGCSQPASLQELATTTITVARNEWKYVANVETQFDAGLPPVPCFRDELSQVLLNLLVNAAHAIEASPRREPSSKGTIRVSTHVDGDWAELRISDTGCGIPESIRHRVFEPFFTTKPVGKGTGQGLAIAYSVVVDKHKGKLLLDSVVGEGTTFHIYLPLTEEMLDVPCREGAT